HRDAAVPELVGHARDERRLGPDHDEVDSERDREAEQPLAVDGPYRMACAEPRDAGIARCGVQLAERGAPGDPPGERVLARARADEEHLHAASLLPPIPASITGAVASLHGTAAEHG